MKNKRGQITSIIAFVVVVIFLVIMAPFLVKLVVTPSQKFSDALGAIDQTNKSVEAVAKITGTFTNTFDYLIIFFFLFNVVILLISSFLVDVHPAFIVVYIVALFFLFMLTPSMETMMDKIYSNTSFTDEVAFLPLTTWIMNNFSSVIFGVAILSGVIMFGKYKFTSGGAGAY